MAFVGLAFVLALLFCHPAISQIYVCVKNSSPKKSCRFNNLKLLADTNMDFHSFARKVCDYLTANTTIISTDVVVKTMLNDVDTTLYNFYQYILLAYALNIELPKSYDTRISRRKIDPYDDIWLEFGVERGYSINVTSIIKEMHLNISLTNEDTLFGFDWFNGLPIEWVYNNRKGSYSMKGSIPIVRNGVKLVVGLFNDTLPTFLTNDKLFHHGKRIGFVNIDNDLYEGARDILVWLIQSGKMRFGALLHFHELVRRKNPQSKCYGQEELLGLYDAMRLLPHIKVELLPYHHTYFQSVILRYITVNRNDKTIINTSIQVPYTYGADARRDEELVQYVRDQVFFKFYNTTTKETIYLDYDEEGK